MLRLTKSEQKSVLFIVGIFFAVVFIRWFTPGVSKTSMYDYSMQDSLFRALSADTTGLKSDSVETVHKRKNRIGKKEKKKTKQKQNEPVPLRININTAGEKELILLPGVGQVTARRIIQYRQENGAFKTVDELLKVKRIGPKTLERIKPFVYLGSPLQKADNVQEKKK